jgi:hypothetical protein
VKWSRCGFQAFDYRLALSRGANAQVRRALRRVRTVPLVSITLRRVEEDYLLSARPIQEFLSSFHHRFPNRRRQQRMLDHNSLLFSPTRDAIPSSDDNFSANDILAAQLALESEAKTVLPFSFNTCTHQLGPLKQAIYACKTCLNDIGVSFRRNSLNWCLPSPPRSARHALSPVIPIMIWSNCSIEGTLLATVGLHGAALDQNVTLINESMGLLIRTTRYAHPAYVQIPF